MSKKADSFLSLSKADMKLEGWILSMLSSKYLIDVKLFLWNWAAFIAVTKGILCASCYPNCSERKRYNDFSLNCAVANPTLFQSFMQLSFNSSNVGPSSSVRGNQDETIMYIQP